MRFFIIFLVVAFLPIFVVLARRNYVKGRVVRFGKIKLYFSFVFSEVLFVLLNKGLGFVVSNLYPLVNVLFVMSLMLAFDFYFSFYRVPGVSDEIKLNSNVDYVIKSTLLLLLLYLSFFSNEGFFYLICVFVNVITFSIFIIGFNNLRGRLYDFKF